MLYSLHEKVKHSQWRILKMATKFLISMLFFASLCGCVSYATRQNEAMQAWVGRTEAQLVETLGAPTSVFKIEDGSKKKVLTYSFHNEGYEHVGVITGTKYHVDASDAIRSYTIDSTGHVVSWSWRDE
jgi:hypothetical protein